jgi:hypothetical protein
MLAATAETIVMNLRPREEVNDDVVGPLRLVGGISIVLAV